MNKFIYQRKNLNIMLKKIQNNVPIICICIIFLSFVLLTCFFVYQYYALELDNDPYKHVVLTPEMEKIYKQLEDEFGKD